jgi:hypothetical protein
MYITPQQLTALAGEEKAKEFIANQNKIGLVKPSQDAILVELIPEAQGIITLKEVVNKVRVIAKGDKVTDEIQLGKIYLIEGRHAIIKSVSYNGEKLSFIHQDSLLGCISEDIAYEVKERARR